MTKLNEDLILSELKRISKLLAIFVGGEMNQTEKVEKFTNLGFKPPEISELFGMPLTSVHVYLGRLKKKSDAKKRKKSSKTELTKEATSNDE